MIKVVKLNVNEVDNHITNLLEGVLDVPAGESVSNLPVSHFKKLIDKKGRHAVIRALTNLQNWFKYKKPSLSKWAIGMKKNLGDYGLEDA